MKVAFINIDDTLGGASIACIRLAEALKKRGIDVSLLTQSKNSNKSTVIPVSSKPWFKYLVKFNFLVERLFFFFFEKNKSVRFAFSPNLFGIDITHYFDFSKIDIIHLHWTNFGFLSNHSLKRIFELDKPIVWTMHDMWVMTGGCHHSGDCTNFKTNCGECNQYLKRPSKTDLSHKLNKSKYELFRSLKDIHFVGCSEWISNRARQSSILRNHPISAIPNPINQNEFFPLDKVEARISLNLASDKSYILFSAIKVTVIWKGYTYLKKSLEILINNLTESEVKNIELLIVGESGSSVESDFPFKTHFLGRINDSEKMNAIYNSADVFVSSSIQENLPNTIMEALATATPCVGFDIGGIPEMIDHQRNGYVSSYKSSSSLAEGLLWVLNHED